MQRGLGVPPLPPLSQSLEHLLSPLSQSLDEHLVSTCWGYTGESSCLRTKVSPRVPANPHPRESGENKLG